MQTVPSPRNHRLLLLLLVPFVAAFTIGAALIAILPARLAGTDFVDIMVRAFGHGPSMTVEERSPNRYFKFMARGLVTFNATDDDIEHVSGRARIVETRDGVTRRIDFKPADGGGVKRVYTVDGREQPLDADGRRWLADVIGYAVREMAIDAPQRVRRLHAQGGADAVLAEIGRMQSGHARRVYCEQLVRLGPLEDKAMDRLLAAIASIHSAFEQRSAWRTTIDQQTLKPAQQVALLNAVANMDAAFEQRSVLVALTPALADEPGVARAWRAAIARVRSDFEVRTILEAMTRRNTLTPAQVTMVLDATDEIHSDFERATVLKSLSRQLPSAGGAPLAAYLRSTQEIQSDFERAGVLTALIKRVELDRAGFLQVLDTIDTIQSNHEKQMALVTVAKKMPRDPAIASRYREVARGLDDFARGQAEKALDRLNL